MKIFLFLAFLWTMAISQAFSKPESSNVLPQPTAPVTEALAWEPAPSCEPMPVNEFVTQKSCDEHFFQAKTQWQEDRLKHEHQVRSEILKLELPIYQMQTRL